jgi:hypothetical protein
MLLLLRNGAMLSMNTCLDYQVMHIYDQLYYLYQSHCLTLSLSLSISLLPYSMRYGLHMIFLFLSLSLSKGTHSPALCGCRMPRRKCICESMKAPLSHCIAQSIHHIYICMFIYICIAIISYGYSGSAHMRRKQYFEKVNTLYFYALPPIPLAYNYNDCRHYHCHCHYLLACSVGRRTRRPRSSAALICLRKSWHINVMRMSYTHHMLTIWTNT